MSVKKKTGKAFCAALALAAMMAGPSEAGAVTLAETQSSISNLQALKNDSEAYLTELSNQLSTLTEDVQALQRQCAETQTAIEVVQVELDAAARKSEQQAEDMKMRIQYMYENTENENVISSLFSAESFLEFLNKAEFIVSVDEYDRAKLAEFQQTQEEIAEKRNMLQAELDSVAALQEESTQKQNEVQMLYDTTSAQIAEYAASISDAQSMQAQLLANVQAQQSTLTQLVGETGAAVTQPVLTGDYSAAGSQDHESSPSYRSSQSSYGYSGSVLTKQGGVNNGPSGKETYYNLNMSGVVQIMRDAGYTSEQYWVRSDGVKMFGDYVMVAADQNVHPLGSVYETSLGMGIVCDTGDFIYDDPYQTDIAVAW
ncbi:MAG TPA: hypothetical protein DCM49_07775 [Lachnospiraceae bacterium]|nr:hypothetical protein [Lachnospiraceae bacterium]